MRGKRQVLTYKEQGLIAFVLVLLLLGGIVRQVRYWWTQADPIEPRNASQHNFPLNT